MKVYIIQTDLGLNIELENRYATSNKDIAKDLIETEIANNFDDTLTDEIMHDISQFAQDLVDGNTKNHYCDEFKGIRIWCDIMEFME